MLIYLNCKSNNYLLIINRFIIIGFKNIITYIVIINYYKSNTTFCSTILGKIGWSQFGKKLIYIVIGY